MREAEVSLAKNKNHMIHRIVWGEAIGAQEKLTKNNIDTLISFK
jgi:hypothetical protein